MINRVILVGRLTADPELRYTQSGVPVASFRIAVDRNFKNSAGERETDFINVVAWRKAGELISQYQKKGDMIGIDGSIQSRNYQSQSGENRTAYEVVVDNFQFLDKAGGRSGGGGYDQAPPPSDSAVPPEASPNAPHASGGGPDDDDLPF